MTDEEEAEADAQAVRRVVVAVEVERRACAQVITDEYRDLVERKGKEPETLIVVLLRIESKIRQRSIVRLP